MRPQKVNDSQLITGLMKVLRSKGYDGASLNELAKATGLQKASLYHRFPKGKKEIAMSVLNYVKEWIHKNILQLLENDGIPAKERLNKVIKNIDALYANGKTTCLLRALAMDAGIELFGKEIKENMELWLRGFTALGLAFGLEEKTAQAKALQVLVNVQGSLVVSRGLSSTHPFIETMEIVKNMYSEK